MLLQEREALVRQASEMEQRVLEHQQSEFEALQKAKSVMEDLENIRLELESVRINDEDHRKEIQRLEVKLKETRTNLFEREQLLLKSSEVQNVMLYRSLEDELKTVQEEVVVLKANLDKTKREKDAAVRELDKIVKSIEAEHSSSTSLVEELTGKMAAITRERDAVLIQCERLKSSSKTMRMEMEQEIERLTIQLSDIVKLNQSLETNMVKANEERKSALKQYDVMHKQYQELRRKTGDEISRHRDTLSEQSATFKNQITEMSNRIEELTERLSQEEQKVNQLQLENERQQSQFMEELKKNVRNMESIIAEVKTENEQLITANDEMSRKMEALKKHGANYLREIQEQEYHRARLQTQLQAAQKRAEGYASQIKMFLAKEAIRLKERKDLILTIERMKLDLERVKKEMDESHDWSFSNRNQKDLDLPTLHNVAPVAQLNRTEEAITVHQEQYQKNDIVEDHQRQQRTSISSDRSQRKKKFRKKAKRLIPSISSSETVST